MTAAKIDNIAILATLMDLTAFTFFQYFANKLTVSGRFCCSLVAILTSISKLLELFHGRTFSLSKTVTFFVGVLFCCCQIS